MSLLSRIKRLLGLNGSAEFESNEPPAVTVERERESQASVETEAQPESSPATETTSPEEMGESGPTADDDATPAASDAADEAVTKLSGIGPTYGEQLDAAGVGTVEELAAADAEDLASRTDISASRIERWIETAEDHLAA